ncbi:SpoIID/LytB domain-containing protein [Paenibacillus thermotolerans]|uniref:SpoIID/LytB domain-containing protein n=1 Tax=Paenibacillus thermotolerans TaxID=3027807 RepID=UPI0023684201|nr:MULTISPECIES: SpoIID/LytB domain-containing protein [unclassified Paenibacillus]
MKTKIVRSIVYVLLTLGLLLPNAASADTGTFAVPQEVRVALFIVTDKYSAPAAAATLSSDGGLRLNRLLPDGSSAPWLETAGSGETRLSAIGFRLLLLETSDAAKAAAVQKELQNAKQQASIFEYTVKGKPIYRVYAGPYGTLAQAEAARTALAGNSALGAQASASGWKLTGPLYAAASAHAAEADAVKAASALLDAGVFAEVALGIDEAGNKKYYVWIGEAASDAQLQQAVSQAVQKAPGIAPAAVDPAAPHLIRRTDRTGASGLGAATAHYIIAGEGHKVIAEPLQATAGIRVKEKSNQAYRGVIELSKYNNALAVVNQLPIESYVASVVGSELDAAWPVEVLKAQAVAARTYVVKQGLKYGIANVADGTADQAYKGIEREFPVAQDAARATAGEVLVAPSGKLLDAFYHSNAGNMTADPMEVWGMSVEGMSSVASLDNRAERGRLLWYRIVFGGSKIGYVRSDYIRLTGETNGAGLPLGTATESGVNVRPAPYVNNETNGPVGTLSASEKVTVIGRDMESTAYQWIRGPISADQLLRLMKASGLGSTVISGMASLRELEITGRGSTTGRVTAMTANDTLIPVQRPENYRTLLNMPSTRFEVEETSKVTVLGAGGKLTSLPSPNGEAAVTVIGAGGRKNTVNTDGYLITTGDGTARYATTSPFFRFIGFGYGHGVGMSQWGAFGLADLGYDYRKILQYYYKDAALVKG